MAVALDWSNINVCYVSIPVVGIVTLFLLKKFFAGGVCRSTNRIDGKTVIITGANTGIGKETAVDLAGRGGRIIIACRNPEKGQEAAKEITQRSGNANVHLKKLDLSSLASVRSFAEEILKTESRLDILVNNAGVMWCPYSKTIDGFEMQLAVNHLGHFLLTNLLLDLLKKSAPSRVVTVSSMGHSMIDKIKFDDINSEKEYGLHEAYAQSKLANVLFARELARRLEGTNVTSYSLHPGAVRTDLARHMSWESFFFFLMYPINIIIMKTPTDGAQTSIYAAVADGVEKYNGQYLADCTLGKVSKAGVDDGMAKKLWDVSVEMVGL